MNLFYKLGGIKIMSIKEKIDQFQELKQEIAEYFDAPIYDGFDDCREYKWYINDNDDVYWFKEGDAYSNEIYGTSVWSKDDYTLVRVNDGCGEKYFQLFDNSLKITQEEYEEMLDEQ
jgi:hypothetical protein